MPVFVQPLAFLGLLSIPALVGIYWLRHRYRRHVVSSLMLWLDQQTLRSGGARLDRLQTPLLFFLELAALALLTLAATAPHWHAQQEARPLVVVLDDSFSMQAGEPDSPRQRALAALEKELDARPRRAIHFVLAGARPQLLGDPARSFREAARLLEGWRCRAPQANLEEAVALAGEVGGEQALLLVLTDHAPPGSADDGQPPFVPATGRLQWWSLGRRLPNRAIVHAARTAALEGDRCLLEVANFSPEEYEGTLHLEAGSPPQPVRQAPLKIAPGKVERFVFELKPGAPGLQARLADDDLNFDNRATLLPPAAARVRVDVRIADLELKELIEKALTAVPHVNQTALRPDLVITDGGEEEVPASAWLLRIEREKEAEAYAGPFIVDRGHPLSDGLSLRGVVWGAGKTTEASGRAIVLAGNVPLLTDVESPGDRHELHLRLRTDLSTLPQAPAWPILFWNLAQWRASFLPGLNRTNVRLGDFAVLNLADRLEGVEVTAPDGTKTKLAAESGRVPVQADDVGSYSIRAGETEYAFAANALQGEESDLSSSVPGTWGNWLDEVSLRLEYRNFAWVFLLAALAILALHGFLVSRGGGRQ
ncbi:MAG: BatA and WFA domain-containing protein [Gemmataceae bacterium]